MEASRRRRLHKGLRETARWQEAHPSRPRPPPLPTAGGRWPHLDGPPLAAKDVGLLRIWQVHESYQYTGALSSSPRHLQLLHGPAQHTLSRSSLPQLRPPRSRPTAPWVGLPGDSRSGGQPRETAHRPPGQGLPRSDLQGPGLGAWGGARPQVPSEVETWVSSAGVT